MRCSNRSGFCVGKEDILKALDYYEKRLKSSMDTAEKDSYRPPFKKSEMEIELVKLARQALTV